MKTALLILLSSLTSFHFTKISLDKSGSRSCLKDNYTISTSDSKMLITGWYYVVDTPTGYKRQLDKSNETYYLNPKPIVTAKNITIIEIYQSSTSQTPGMTMRLNKDGTKIWSDATRSAEIHGTKLAFILDNRLLQIAVVNAQITGGVTALNSGNYTRSELENFKKIIEEEK